MLHWWGAEQAPDFGRLAEWLPEQMANADVGTGVPKYRITDKEAWVRQLETIDYLAGISKEHRM